MKNSSADLQAEFDAKYIGVPECLKRLRISRTSFLYGRRKGWMPNGILVPGSTIGLFLRSEAEPFMNQWARQLERNPNAVDHAKSTVVTPVRPSVGNF